MNKNLVRRLRTLEKEHKKEWGGATEESCLIAEAADAIEAMSAQLEQKTKSTLPTRKRKIRVCGGRRTYQFRDSAGLYYLRCSKCGKESPHVEAKEKLFDAWNSVAEKEED